MRCQGEADTAALPVRIVLEMSLTMSTEGRAFDHSGTTRRDQITMVAIRVRSL